MANTYSRLVLRCGKFPKNVPMNLNPMYSLNWRCRERKKKVYYWPLLSTPKKKLWNEIQVLFALNQGRLREVEMSLPSLATINVQKENHNLLKMISAFRLINAVSWQRTYSDRSRTLTCLKIDLYPTLSNLHRNILVKPRESSLIT